MMRVSLELEDGEVLKCNKCGQLFQGTAIIMYLDIDEAFAVEAVYCSNCVNLSSEQRKIEDTKDE